MNIQMVQEFSEKDVDFSSRHAAAAAFKRVARAKIALSYFPELKDIKIEFKYSKEATTMAARPAPLSVLSNRKYIILINNKKN